MSVLKLGIALVIAGHFAAWCLIKVAHYSGPAGAAAAVTLWLCAAELDDLARRNSR